MTEHNPYSNDEKERHKTSFVFYEVGFHGDEYLLELIDDIAKNNNIDCFIETGANVGSTLAYFAKKNPHVHCYSCEPDHLAYDAAQKNVSTLPNVNIFNLDSIEFLNRLLDEVDNLNDKKAIFWLDAHGYGFQWPLKEEVAFVSGIMKNCFMFIDDFKVPENSLFGFDSYNGQECSFEYINESISDREYSLYYPNYSEKTSMHHPLRGWSLFVFGDDIQLSNTSYCREYKK